MSVDTFERNGQQEKRAAESFKSNQLLGTYLP